MRKEKIEKLKEIESKINRNLFNICAGVTVVAMAMVAGEFFTCGFFSSIRIEFFYIGILLIYSLHKEMVRWLGDIKVERQGEYFVYIWIALTTSLYVINFLTRGSFSYMADCDTSGVLKDATLITLEVAAVFISTRFLKLLKIILRG